VKLIAKVVPTTAEVLTAQELIPCCTKAYPASNVQQHQVNGISEATSCKTCQPGQPGIILGFPFN